MNEEESFGIVDGFVGGGRMFVGLGNLLAGVTVSCVHIFFLTLKVRRELFFIEVNNKETIAAIEANNDMYCLEKRIEKFLLTVIKISKAKALNIV